MSDLLVCAPLRLEELAIRSGGRRLRVRKTGMGRARSLAAVPSLRGDPAAAVAVMGVCGGLEEHCEPGEVVVADALIDGEQEQPARTVCPSGAALVDGLARHGVRARLGTVVSVARIAHGEKRVQLRERGAVVVDMESAWLAGGAGARPFAVLRVVADTPAREVTRPLLTLAGAARAALSLRQAAAALERLVREQGARTALGGEAAALGEGTVGSTTSERG